VRRLAVTAATGVMAVILGVLTVAAYAAPAKPKAAESATVADGKRLIMLKGCAGCHTVPGVVGFAHCARAPG